MKKLLFKLGVFLIGKKNVYIRDMQDGTKMIILTDNELPIEIQVDINESIKTYESFFSKRDYDKNKMVDILEKMMNTHKGTVEDGKCFLAADDFVLGLDKEGNVKSLVDCTTNKSPLITIEDISEQLQKIPKDI
jgi:hypothetical protein